ncbi:conserved hypothetical protein [Methanococcus vannielii SB]|uniref:Uncharacterized protein n=1 Tax=Methanococcus vannielii (strain ATCC 35089 / DSM 1224 / JCM 13029 / OCM 148 / SB) TaxID=406327 RepID=A6UPQ9_METVS|nr:zinc ribbon domain-containing protein [Methanococcus vannielii]ABR54481.1 conserved hypothetical protein [Methanococcus vannielii SB]
MVTVIPINEEERASIINGLKSSVPATKLITLKKIVDLTILRPESLQYMEMTDKQSIQRIISGLERIMEYDVDEVLKREATITLEKLKITLGSKFVETLNYCKNCNAVIDLGWENCANCGSNLIEMNFEESKDCPNCKKHTTENWNNCAHCGFKLIEERDRIIKCSNCKREVDSSWMMCPYCGTRLKSLKK